MKKLAFFALAAVFFVSCSSDDDSGTPLSSSPDAKAIYDDSNYGIYKGVFVGSSGVVTIDINNNGSVEATLVIDGNSRTFTTTETVEENGTISGLTFTNGSDHFDFSVTGSGDGATIDNVVMSGHPNATIKVVKEFSYAQVECFKGTFNGDDSGVFNLIVIDGNLYGLARSNGSSDDALFLDGYVDVETDAITGSFEGGAFAGTRNGNSMSGQWTNLLGEAGNWSGTRKL